MERQQVLDVSAHFVADVDRDNDLSLSRRQELIDRLEQHIANEHKAAQHYWGLSLSCAKKVYYVWHSAHQEIDLRVWIQKFLASRGLQPRMEELARLHKFLDVIWQSNPSIDNGVAMAAAMTIYATGRDATVGRVRPPFINPGDSDIDLAPEYRDAAHYASVAYSRGHLSDPQSDAGLRHEFWTWYLMEAVPAAYSAPI